MTEVSGNSKIPTYVAKNKFSTVEMVSPFSVTKEREILKDEAYDKLEEKFDKLLDSKV